MKIVKGILSSLVLFIFGLEVGGFTMWYLTMKSISDLYPRSTSREKPYTYRGRDYSDE